MMDNYSPSHPTDDMDIDDSDDAKPKDPDSLISKENVIVNNWQPIDHLLEGGRKESPDVESSAWAKELNTSDFISSDKSNLFNLGNSPSRISKRSRSKSVEKRSISKTGSKRSRSRSGNRRSRSRNRRSRSDNRRSKSANRRRRSKSGARRSTSRSHSRNRRSRSRNRNNRNDSRNRNTRSYGRDKETKRPKSRSKSPIEKAHSSSKDSRRRDSNRNSKSPECRSNLDRKDDNIFNKLSEIRGVTTNDSPKEKWGCDSDEETTPTVIKNIQSTFPDNRGRSDNYGERSFNDRQNFGDRRGRGSRRGGPPGQGRSNFGNDNYGGRDVRSQPWSQSRQDWGNERNTPQVKEMSKEKEMSPVVASKNAWGSDDESSNWGKKVETKLSPNHNEPNVKLQSQPKQEINKERDISPVAANKNAWGSDEESSNWGKKVEAKLSPIRNEPSGKTVSLKSDNEVKKNAFAADSDEEFGTWGKETKAENSPPNVGRVSNDAPYRAAEEPRGWSNDTQQQARPPPPMNARNGTEGGFSAWKNAQKAEPIKPLQAAKFADNSDEEFGSWGKETRSNAGEKVPFKAADSDDDCGTWGNERRAVKAAPSDESFYEAPREDDSFGGDRRGNFPSRGGFNNNQFAPRRGGGGQRNFGNNRFQRPPSQDRFFNNAPNYNSDNNYSGGNSGYNSNYNNAQPPLQPNYNYKPPQMPQWATQAQSMAYPSRPSAQMPFQIDTSICPPMNLLQSQIHQPPMQLMQQMPFIPPPPPSIAMDSRGPPMAANSMMNILGGSMGQSAMAITQSNNINQSTMSMSQSNNINQLAMSIGQNANNMQSSNIPPAPANINQAPLSNSFMDNNLLETLMTKAGLSSSSLRLDKKQDSSNSMNETLSTMLKTAATTVISRLVESSNQKHVATISDNMSMSPPSPPSNSPPPALIHALYGGNVTSQQSAASFIPPPLPNYSDVLKPSTNKITNPVVSKLSTDVPDEEKRNRSDFNSKIDWQERVALEVKVFLKPAYMTRSIDKNDYKEIMKRCVTKITRSGVAEINSEKIEKFVLSYVEKYNKNRKVKQHSTVSSSEHDLRCD